MYFLLRTIRILRRPFCSAYASSAAILGGDGGAELLRGVKGYVLTTVCIVCLLRILEVLLLWEHIGRVRYKLLSPLELTGSGPHLWLPSKAPRKASSSHELHVLG